MAYRLSFEDAGSLCLDEWLLKVAIELLDYFTRYVQTFHEPQEYTDCAGPPYSTVVFLGKTKVAMKGHSVVSLVYFGILFFYDVIYESHNFS